MSKVIKCDSCKHCEVCKYKKDFQALNEKIQEMFYEKSEPSPFDVEATCKYFSKPIAEAYWPEGVKDLKDFKWPNSTKGINEQWLDCDSCPNNPKYNPLGFQVGDTPCTWCPKMQPKVTSDLNSTNNTLSCPKDIDIKATAAGK